MCARTRTQFRPPFGPTGHSPFVGEITNYFSTKLGEVPRRGGGVCQTLDAKKTQINANKEMNARLAKKIAPQFTKCKQTLDLSTLNICLAIKLLLMQFITVIQFYNIQFAYKIGNFGKIVMQKYHLKNFHRGRQLFIFSFTSDIAKLSK